MKDDALLTVVDVEIVRHHMFSEHETIPESLHGDIVQHLIVVLVAGHHQPNGMARIRLKRLAENRVANIVVKTELRITHNGT